MTPKGELPMTEIRELRIPYDDLTRVVIDCSCGTELSIDLPRALEQDWETKGLLCVVCGKSPDSQIKTGLNHLANWYSCTKDSGAGKTISFRVKAG